MKPILLTTLAVGALTMAACGNNADKTGADAAADAGMDASATAPADVGTMAPADGSTASAPGTGTMSGSSGSMSSGSADTSSGSMGPTGDVPATTPTGTPGSEAVMTGGRQNFTPPSSPNMGSQGPSPTRP